MASEYVTLIANGQVYEGWKSIEIEAALNQAVRSFQADVAELLPEGATVFGKWPLLPGTAVQVLATGQLIFTGYIDVYAPDVDDQMHTVTVTSRSRGQDYVDTSADHPTGYFEDKTDMEIADELDVAGVGIDTDAPPSPKLSNFNIRQGDSPHTNMMNILPEQGKTMKGTADGGIMITKPGQQRHPGGLIFGISAVKHWSAVLTGMGRYQTYKVKGQNSIGSKKDNLRAYGEATDPNVKRKRVKIFNNYRQSDPKSAKDRAQYEAARAAGFSYKAQVTTFGWRDEDGAFWEPGNLVYVECQPLKLQQDMMIEKVTFTQEDAPQGTTADLELVDPRAYNPDLSVTSQSGSEWGSWGFRGR